MKVFYEDRIIDRLLDIKEKAECNLSKIDYVSLNRTEWEELGRWVELILKKDISGFAKYKIIGFEVRRGQ